MIPAGRVEYSGIKKPEYGSGRKDTMACGPQTMGERGGGEDSKGRGQREVPFKFQRGEREKAKSERLEERNEDETGTERDKTETYA